MAAEQQKDFEMIPLLVNNMKGNNWKLRFDSLNGLMQMAERTQDELQISNKFVLVLETLIKGVTDSNAKVAFKAIEVLEKFIPLFKTGIEQNAQLVLTGLSANLCSTNILLRNKTDLLIDLLVDTLESDCLAEGLVHLALYGNSRARAPIISHLCGTFNLL